MNSLKKKSLVILIIMGLTVRDKHIYIALPFLIYVLWGNIKDLNRREQVLEYTGIIGAIYTVLGLSFEGFINNRGLFLMLIALILQKIYYKKSFKIPYKPIIYAYFTIFILGIIWNICSPGGIGGIGRFVSVNKKFISIILLYNVINKEEKFKKLIDIFLIGTVIAGIYGIGRYFYYIDIDPNYRLDGFMNIPYSAGTLMMGSLIFFGKIWENFNIKNKISYLYGLGFIITYIAMILTKTRAVMIGSILGILLIMVLKINIKKTFLCLCMGLILFLISPKEIKDNVISRVSQITIKANEKTANTVSDNFRRVMWHGSIYAWEQSKIFGVGSKNTGNYVQKYADISKDENGYLAPEITREMFTYREAHSIYLNYLAEVGLLIVLYLGLLFIIIPNLIYKIWKEKKLKYEGEYLGASGAIAGYYFYGLVWSVWGYYGLIQDMFQFMLFILIMVYFYNKGKDR